MKHVISAETVLLVFAMYVHSTWLMLCQCHYQACGYYMFCPLEGIPILPMNSWTNQQVAAFLMRKMEALLPSGSGSSLLGSVVISCTLRMLSIE